ncbi:MAG TPA: DNA recombination protein RmuC [Methylomirabilota bacterium]|nr:DNA recombination protein RmuC [Methylomirabilota bacterium]
MDFSTVMLVILTAGVILIALGIFGLSGRFKDLEAARGQPDQAIQLLQREIQATREESARSQLAATESLRLEMHQFTGQVTAQLGQVNTGVQQQLQHVTEVVGQVQGTLGQLGEVTQRVFDVGRDIAGLEAILKSPKIRGGLGETFLENLLGQMLGREHYELQYPFKSGNIVDAAIRIGGRLVCVDAKFPLENFRRLMEESDDEKRRQFRRTFVRDVKARVDEIAKKYILPDEGTFDFALMYVPAENVYYEIVVKSDDGGETQAVSEYALERKVVPVSPNSLYAYLQVIVLGLRGLQIERDAQEIQARLGRLSGDLDRFREAFDVVGRHLTNAKNKYDEATIALGRIEAKLEGIDRRGEQAALPGTDG